MSKPQSNSDLNSTIIDLSYQSLEETPINKNESMHDKERLCNSTSGESSIEELLISEEEEFLLEIAKNQHKITNYRGDKDIAYSSRSNILTWALKLLNAVTLTSKQKNSIFHRFAIAYDLINEKLFIEKHSIHKDKPFKKLIVSLFLIVYKLEGYTIGKITIRSLIDAFLKEANIREADIRRTEIRILKAFDYQCFAFEDNPCNLTIVLFEIIKRKYNLTSELACLIKSSMNKMNKLIQFSNDLVFDIYPIDKAAISIYALIMHLNKKHFNANEEQYTYQLIHYEMALLINNLYSYLKTVLKVITIKESDFKHYAAMYSDMMSK